ncbi:S49 family peptidase [Propioniciclava soli]|uniref:S49 family peptidase n=1 Tax=Propioniciclava soli TaxID=2775081 RepID=UPI001E310795|nr:S49 family peptidase [Propioniciclava soli]
MSDQTPSQPTSPRTPAPEQAVPGGSTQAPGVPGAGDPRAGAPFPPGGAAPAVAGGRPPVPPPYAAAPPAPRREGGFKRGFGIGSGVGLGLGAAAVALSLVGGVVSVASMAAFAGMASSMAGVGQTQLETMNTVWGPETATNTLRAIPIEGTIMAHGSDGLGLTGGTYGYEVADLLDDLTAEDAGGVVLLMNTPGGSISGSAAMSSAMERYKERTGKPVYAYVQDMSASGGMWTMAGADEILADHGSLVGSVGVIMGPIAQYTDVVAVDGGILGGGVTTTGGVTQEYITAGRGKDVGNPYRPLTDEERADLQSFIDQEYAAFVDHVATARDIAPSVIVDDLGAAMLGTERAQEVGYIDGVMGRPEAFRHFAEAAGLDPDDTKVEQSAGPDMWGSLFGIERAFGTAPAAQPVDGQPARVTSTLCTSSRTPLAWDPQAAASFCG